MKKLKYEKPVAFNAGAVAAIQGAFCSFGDSASDACRTGEAAGGGCGSGNNPTMIPYCDSGSVATGNCYPAGGNAGQSCHDGSTPGW